MQRPVLSTHNESTTHIVATVFLISDFTKKKLKLRRGAFAMEGHHIEPKSIRSNFPKSRHGLDKVDGNRNNGDPREGLSGLNLIKTNSKIRDRGGQN